MADKLNDGQLRDQMAKVNARDTNRITLLLDRFSGGERALVQSIGEYRTQLGLGGDGVRSRGDIGRDNLDFYQNGAHAFIQVLSEHPIFYEKRSLSAGAPIFGHTQDPFLSELGRDVSELLVAGALAIGLLGTQDQRYVDALIHVAFNADAISNLLRIILRGRWIDPIDYGPEHYWNNIPDKLQNLDKLMDLNKNTCVSGVRHALMNYAIALASNKATSWSTGITALRPNHGCAGDQVALHGTGFGQTKPGGVEVWFPTLDGRCTQAQIAHHKTAPFAPQWSDTKIVAIVPKNVGNGCVGFVQLASGGAPLAGPAGALAGEMEQCFGIVASSAAQTIRNVADKALFVPCPPCLKNGANYFQGGPPWVEYFSIGGSDDLFVEPDTELTLAWRVHNATTVQVQRLLTAGPFIDVTGPIQASRNIGKFTGSVPNMAEYMLTATNACGTIKRYVKVRLRATPSLKILGVEVIQAIQHFDLADPSLNNTITLVANKRTMVRLYVDSGITNGFDSGGGPNRQPDVMGGVSIWPSRANRGFEATLIVPSLGIYIVPPESEIRQSSFRSTLGNTLNFELPVTELNGTVRIEARVWVQGHENDVGTGWYTYDLNTVVNFEPRRTQTLMRILVRDDDPRRMLPAPTAVEYTTTMQGATTRYPIAENGFIVVIPPGFEEITTALGVYDFLSDSTDADLAGLNGWTRLIDHVEWIAGQYPDQGAIWTALVPRSPVWVPPGSPPGSGQIPVYAIAGLGHSAWSNSGQYLGKHRCFAAMNLFPSGFAHEMGHTFAPPGGIGIAHMQIGHASCPTPGQINAPGNVDDRLPTHTEDIGMDVAQITLIPSGAPEIMSYCFPDPRWPSIAFWDMVFDELN